MTLTRRQVTDLLDAHGLRPSRALGQNFVADPNTVRRIARLAGVGPGDRIVEIGAGLGCLTLALAETGAAVTAVEVDRGLLPVLRSVVAGDAVEVVAADAMHADWDGLLGAGPWVLVANLPYNIATPLVADLLDGVPAVTRMVVMVQREVGERLVAGPGTAAYGAVSVKVAYWAEAGMLGRVPASVFVPRPKVESVLVGITRRAVPAVAPALVGPADLFALVRAGFAQRRKMLRRALAGLVPEAAFAVAGVAPEARAEELGVEAWGRLAAAALPGRDGRAVTDPDAVVTVEAYAKLTLSLRVTGVRPDGYHLLDSEMVTVDLADTLAFRPGDGLEVVGSTGAPVPSDDTNLVRRALAAVGRRAAVHLTKRIPAGGGLGGGSADAAAVLRWAGCRDLDLAVGLGGDVPFCLVGGRARVTGIGEAVEPLDRAGSSGSAFTLLIPPFGVATVEVYRAWDRLGGPSAEGPNDLEPAALVVEPRLAEWRVRLGDATGVTPTLAGSGATWWVPGAHPGPGRLVVTVVPPPPIR